MIAVAPIEYNPNRFGYKFKQIIKDGRTLHPGTDLNAGNSANADFNLPIKAPFAGEVIFRTKTKGWGNLIVIYSYALNRWTRMAHMNKVFVNVGDVVAIGEEIGTVGKTGTFSSHLHWEIIKKQLLKWTEYTRGWNQKKIDEYFEDPLLWLKLVNSTQISDFAVGSYEKAKEKLVNLKLDNPQDVVGDSVAEQVFLDLKVLNKKIGNLTKERLIVALDRLGLLD